jgi:hypothetical protein
MRRQFHLQSKLRAESLFMSRLASNGGIRNNLGEAWEQYRLIINKCCIAGKLYPMILDGGSVKLLLGKGLQSFISDSIIYYRANYYGLLIKYKYNQSLQTNIFYKQGVISLSLLLRNWLNSIRGISYTSKITHKY